MTTNLAEFWETQHAHTDGQWLTGTSWELIQQFYGISAEDFRHKVCLEIGVGKGFITRSLSTLCQDLYCCDISDTALTNVKDFATQTWLSRDIDQVPPVDIVLCHLVFVHCDDDECRRILRSIQLNPQARIFCQFSCFSDPNIGSSQATATVQQLLDVGVKHFFRTPDDIQQLLKSVGLTVINEKKCHPGDYHGWTQQFWQFYELQR